MRTACLAALLACGTASADPHPMSAGAMPAPITSSEVALVKETLVLKVVDSEMHVVADLTLANRGPATTLMVGFPCEAGEDPGIVALDCKTRIAIKVDGKKVAAKRKGTNWIWPMKLAAGASPEVQVSYRAKMKNERYSDGFSGLLVLHYRLITGAAWAGPIDELDMRVELPTEVLLHVSPPGYTRSPGVLEWKLKNVEPSSDVAVLVHPMLIGRDTHLRKKGGGPALAKLAKEMRERTEDLVADAAQLHAIGGKKLGLPEPKPDEVRKTFAESLRIIEEQASAK